MFSSDLIEQKMYMVHLHLCKQNTHSHNTNINASLTICRDDVNIFIDRGSESVVWKKARKRSWHPSHYRKNTGMKF